MVDKNWRLWNEKWRIKTDKKRAKKAGRYCMVEKLHGMFILFLKHVFLFLKNTGIIIYSEEFLCVYLFAQTLLHVKPTRMV